MVNELRDPTVASRSLLVLGTASVIRKVGYLRYSHSGPAIPLGAFHIACRLSQKARDREAVVIITAWGGGAPSSILMGHSTIAYSMRTALCGSSPRGVIPSSLDHDLLLV